MTSGREADPYEIGVDSGLHGWISQTLWEEFSGIVSWITVRLITKFKEKTTALQTVRWTIEATTKGDIDVGT